MSIIAAFRLDQERQKRAQAELEALAAEERECTFKPKVGRGPVKAIRPIPLTSRGACSKCERQRKIAEVCTVMFMNLRCCQH